MDELRSFTDATNIYLNALHSVDVRLKRQIYGLVESGIIARNKEGGMGKPDVPEPARVTGDRSASSLDVGWLNSRSDKVDRLMEAELWERSRAFLEDTTRENPSGCISTNVDESIEDEDMMF
jgi:Mediator complex protein